MLGIELPDIIRFITQISLVVAGAASLWGAVFFWKNKTTTKKDREYYYKLSQRISILFFLSIAAFAIFRIIFSLTVFPLTAIAHEGIVIKPTLEEIFKGIVINNNLVVFSLIISLIHFSLFAFKKELLKRCAGILLTSNFILISAIILLSVYSGEIDKTQVFHFFHNWHSVLTLGTVICVDFLFLFTMKDYELRRRLYSIFPLLSAAIWIGLGIDFLSVGLIFNEAFKVNSQFLFNQTLIGIIIINGAGLSGRINKTLKDIADPDHPRKMSSKMKFIFGLSGSISIVSWLTITALDFFTITLSYFEFMVIYASIIAIAFITQDFIENKILKA